MVNEKVGDSTTSVSLKQSDTMIYFQKSTMHEFMCIRNVTNVIKHHEPIFSWLQTCIKLAGAKQSDVDARARSVECLLAQDVRKGIKNILSFEFRTVKSRRLNF